MNTSNKNLLQILVEELPKRGGWPKGFAEMSQGAITGYIYADGHRILFRHNVYGGGDLVTREQYEAALAAQAPVANADDWIDWAGGRIPVDVRAIVDVKFNNGSIHTNQPAGGYSWAHEWEDSNIIAYRLHQPQKLEEHTHVGEASGPLTQADFAQAGITEADDEADLNECIGQTPEDLEQLTRLMVEDINYSCTAITLADAYKIASNMIDAGYRKQ